MKYSIYTILFTLITFSLHAQQALDNGRSNHVTPTPVVKNNALNENIASKEIFNGSDQDDPNAPMIESKEDVFYPINLDELKSKIRNSGDTKDMNQRIDELTQQMYELTLFNEQLSQENQDIKQSLRNCCNANESDRNSFLVQNSPNPFNEYTKIDYFIGSKSENSRIVVRTLNGIEVLSVDVKNTGYNSFDLTSEGLESGYYVYTLYDDKEVIDSKVLIVSN